MPEAAIAAQGVFKRFGSKRGRSTIDAVAGLDLHVEPGEVAALIGPNGAGKTTTLRMLLGFVRPDAGIVKLDGLPSGQAASRRRVGYLAEGFRPYDFHTARGSLAFLGCIQGVDPEQLHTAVDLALTRVGLHDVANRRAGTFSKGMRQRLGIAQALLHRPRILILDEPTSGLDPAGRGLFAKIIEHERECGAAILLSTHILEDVERLSDRVLVLNRGRIVLAGSVDELTQEHRGWWIDVGPLSQPAKERIRVAGFALPATRTEPAKIPCEVSRKQELLTLLLDEKVEIHGMRPRTRSLEDVYLEHVGMASDA